MPSRTGDGAYRRRSEQHDDAAAAIDLCGTACVQVRPDGDDLVAFDQHVSARENHPLSGPSTSQRLLADDVPAAPSAAIVGRVIARVRGHARRVQ